MASFQAKTSWERPRKREKKNYRSDQFLLDPKQRIPKKQQKIQKIKKHHYGFFSGQNGTGLTEKKKKKYYRSDQLLPDQEQKIPKQVGRSQEREKIRKIAPISFYPTRNREFQKYNKKNSKN